MNASILKRTLVIGGIVALPWIGCSAWTAHRERAEKEALAAEIRVEMAARAGARLEEQPGLEDLTRAYQAALADSGNFGVPQRVHQHVASTERGDVPAYVAEFVEGRTAALDGFAAAIGDLPPGRMSLEPDQWTRLGSIHGGLRVRGWVQSRTGDLDGLLSTVRLLRRIAADASASTAVDLPIWPANMALSLERTALDQLGRLAVHPALGEPQAEEALAIAIGPWKALGAHNSLTRFQLDGIDELLLDLLGDDAWKRMRERNLTDDTSNLDIVGGLLQGRNRVDRGFPEGLPPVAVLRRMREILARQRVGYERRDGAAVILGGPLDSESREDLGGGWRAGIVSFFPQMARGRWTYEAAVPVLRAAFALRLHEIRGGGIPATLDALVPGLLDAVPLDSWTGEPVRYTPRPGGWVLEAGHPEGSYTHYGGWTEYQKPFRIEK